MKVLTEKVHSRSLSSIHILYNQALVGGLRDTFDPATRIGNVSLAGGSISWICEFNAFSVRKGLRAVTAALTHARLLARAV